MIVFARNDVAWIGGEPTMMAQNVGIHIIEEFHASIPRFRPAALLLSFPKSS